MPPLLGCSPGCPTSVLSSSNRRDGKLKGNTSVRSHQVQETNTNHIFEIFVDLSWETLKPNHLVVPSPLSKGNHHSTGRKLLLLLVICAWSWFPTSPRPQNTYKKEVFKKKPKPTLEHQSIWHLPTLSKQMFVRALHEVVIPWLCAGSAPTTKDSQTPGTFFNHN